MVVPHNYFKAIKAKSSSMVVVKVFFSMYHKAWPIKHKMANVTNVYNAFRNKKQIKKSYNCKNISVFPKNHRN